MQCAVVRSDSGCNSSFAAAAVGVGMKWSGAPGGAQDLCDLGALGVGIGVMWRVTPMVALTGDGGCWYVKAIQSTWIVVDRCVA
jgi:hypothetical protein